MMTRDDAFENDRSPNGGAASGGPGGGGHSGQFTAIVGGGISGLAAAYELARRGAEFALFEASARLGGTVETVHRNGFTIECGPDSWVTEKPWAARLAIELGIEDQIIPSNDRQRTTYLVKNDRLIAMPQGMRMMVPTQWQPILESPLLSAQARLAYQSEPGRAQELRASAPNQDESVASFVQRHFGEEVTASLAAPLLAGVLGGDIQTLSVRAVMPGLVKMESEHGSLIVALERARSSRLSHSSPAIFSTLASGMGTLIDRLAEQLPSHAIHLRQEVTGIHHDSAGWRVATQGGERRLDSLSFDSLVLATPTHVTRELLRGLGDAGRQMGELLPAESTSAIVVSLAFDRSQTDRVHIPCGFGFLVPPASRAAEEPDLLACTFADQKFPGRAPEGAVLLRAFFGGPSAEALLSESDEAVTRLAERHLSRLLGVLGEPVVAVVRRWPRSLPQYTVGHLERIARLAALAGSWPGLRLVGNAYHGVGVSDLIREGRTAAQAVLGS